MATLCCPKSTLLWHSDEPGGWEAGPKCSTQSFPRQTSLHNEGVSKELRTAGPAFPVCRDEAARGTYASEALPQAADPGLNALLNRTAEVLCWPVASHLSNTQMASMHPPSTHTHRQCYLNSRSKHLLQQTKFLKAITLVLGQQCFRLMVWTVPL